MIALLPVDNLVALLEQGIKANDPLAVAATAEWTMLMAGLQGMMHVMTHVDPAVIDKATQDALACGGVDRPDLH